MGYNTDYRKELKEGQEVNFLKRKCPKCEDKLVALPPDRAWCASSKCSYGEMHMVGKGVMGQEMMSQSELREERLSEILEK